jgi:hypothetical protein
MIVPNIEGVSLHTALIHEADAAETQAERSLESIPLLCLSPVKVTNVNFGTSATHMTATTFVGANKVILQSMLPSFPSTSLLVNVNPSSDKNRKTQYETSCFVLWHKHKDLLAIKNNLQEERWKHKQAGSNKGDDATSGSDSDEESKLRHPQRNGRT